MTRFIRTITHIRIDFSPLRVVSSTSKDTTTTTVTLNKRSSNHRCCVGSGRRQSAPWRRLACVRRGVCLFDCPSQPAHITRPGQGDSLALNLNQSFNNGQPVRCCLVETSGTAEMQHSWAGALVLAGACTHHPDTTPHPPPPISTNIRSASTSMSTQLAL